MNPPPPAVPDQTTPELDLVVIGLGNMGAAVLGAALETGVLDPARVGVIDSDADRSAAFTARGCRAVGPEVAGLAPRILLAIKPQVFPEVALTLGPTPVGGRRLAISVMAGLRSARIAEALGAGTAVLRTMPNTPAAIRLAVTAMAPGPGATKEDMAWTRRLFESVGTVIEIDEPHFHAVTATSGSGPAWLFRVAEAWIAAAIAEGLPPEVAHRLVVDTIVGAAGLLGAGDRSPSELRVAVTSKGGTTAAGLDSLTDRDFDAVFGAAIKAATARGHDLDV